MKNGIKLKFTPILTFPLKKGGRDSLWLDYSKNKEKGAAIITALFVAMLAALLVSGLLWRAQVQIRRVENQRLKTQVQWIARGLLDWSLFIVNQDAKISPVTTLNGLWSIPIARTPLSVLIGKQFSGNVLNNDEQIYVSGVMEDAQAKFNLRNLVKTTTPGHLKIDPTALAQFQKLLSILGVDSGLASRIAEYILASLQHSIVRFHYFEMSENGINTNGINTNEINANKNNEDDNSGAQNSVNNPLVMTSINALLNINGVNIDLLNKLKHFIDFLPMPTAVNLNTASAEVIAAMIPTLNLSAAQNFIQSRDKAFLINLGDAKLRFQRYAVNTYLFDSKVFDVTTHYFLVKGLIENQRAASYVSALIFRNLYEHNARIISVSKT